ncbi:MAG: hypothetical protein M3P26_04465 [Gemmatimonadota bacterium]|nr:hypothetical protein [Gemmatimonadota bacterium]
MFDYNTATPTELIAEAERRRVRRFGGTVAPTPEQEQKKEMELEKELQARVIRLYVKAGCKVRSTSQPRKAKFITPGGADLQVFSPLIRPGYREIRVMWYHETKRDGGKYSEAQLEFAADCRDAGITCIGGGVKEAQEQLDRLGL